MLDALVPIRILELSNIVSGHYCLGALSAAGMGSDRDAAVVLNPDHPTGGCKMPLPILGGATPSSATNNNWDLLLIAEGTLEV